MLAKNHFEIRETDNSWYTDVTERREEAATAELVIGRWQEVRFDENVKFTVLEVDELGNAKVRSDLVVLAKSIGRFVNNAIETKV